MAYSPKHQGDGGQIVPVCNSLEKKNMNVQNISRLETQVNRFE
jgi:hypothetical protein